MDKREKERLFRMKQFNVRHSVSANKVGVDGVLVGAWTEVASAETVLDAGTGCGLIALMIAQRAPDAKILAIEIVDSAVKEARLNVSESPWRDRIQVEQADFSLLCGKYDLIVSNPPFFHAGVDSTVEVSARTLARHSGSLSPEGLILCAKDLLNPGGRLSFIAQSDSEKKLLDLASGEGLILERICRVKGTPDAPAKRVLLQFLRNNDENKSISARYTELVIGQAPNRFSPDYTELCRPFYIKIPDRDDSHHL